jgi:hypothetical protein
MEKGNADEEVAGNREEFFFFSLNSVKSDR